MSCSKKKTVISLTIIIYYLRVVLFLLIMETRSAASHSYSYSMVKPNCQEKCGNVSIPYPFGIGKGCYLNKKFEVTCINESTPFSGGQVFQISLDHHYVIKEFGASVLCHSQSDGGYPYWIYYNLDHQFLISHTKNKFVVLGCDVFTYITELRGVEYISGCASLCYNKSSDGLSVPPSLDFDNNKSSCSGIGCCQTSLPKDIGAFDVRSISLNTYGRHWTSKLCTIALIVENNFTEFSNFNLSAITEYRSLRGGPTVLDWAISNISCHEARTRQDYACGPNSNCIHSNSSYGIRYRCRCYQGYQGNPYLQINGCQDIDECKDPKMNTCPKDAFCINTKGGYSCTCRPGYRSIHIGNGIECIPQRGSLAVIFIPSGIGIAIGFLLLIAIGLWLHRKLEKKRRHKIKQKFFKRNGGLLLQQQISSNKDSVARIKLLATEELEKATDYFNSSRFLGKGGLGSVYKGMLSDGSIVAVKKSNIVDENQVGQFINEVIILSHISHRNIVKLLGCCLETEVPILVYEYISNGTLSDHLYDEGYASMSWDNRLRVAREIAGALVYLHSYASTPIFHRDIKASNILLDENYRAVVSDFGLSRLVPFNKTHLTTLVGGTFGYLDPVYFRSRQFTDKSDVYAFGVVLAELLTGKKAVSSDISEGLVLYFRSSMKQNRLLEILEPLVVHDGKEEEIHVVARLAKRCLKLNAKKRPSMQEVTIELDQLRRIKEQPVIQQNSLDCLVSKRSFSYAIDSVEEEVY